MKNFKITIHDPSVTLRVSPAFYILSRGLSAGLPTPEPYKHCVCFFCDPADMLDYYYYIYSLWKADIFQEYMSFEKIPELSTGDIQDAINENIKIIGEIEQCITQHYNPNKDHRPTGFRTRILEAAKIYMLFQKYNP